MKPQKQPDSQPPTLNRVGNIFNRLKTAPLSIYTVIFFLLVLTSIVFKICKCHIAGIVYDESFTWLHFGKDIYHSPTLEHPNFHVLTAIFDQWAHHLFGSYEHFVRIPGMIFGTIFSITTAYIIHKTIKSKLIKLALLALVLFNPFTLNLSFLARGYSIALCGIYSQLAIIVFLISHKIKLSFRWLIIVLMAFTNFLTFGSMPSCVWVLFGTNAIFVLLYSRTVFSSDTGRLKSAIINIVSIPIATLIPLFLLYRENFAGILSVKDDFGSKASWFKYMTIILRDKIINPDNPDSAVLHSVIVVMVLLALLVLIFRAVVAFRKKNLFTWTNLDDPGLYFIFATVLALLMYCFHRHVLNVSIGFPRNGVVLIPLSLIAAAIVIDKAIQSINQAVIRAIPAIVTAVAMIYIAASNPPSMHAMNVYTWDFQSSAGPLLRKLKQIDPDHVWLIALTKERTWSLNLPLSYYRQFDYKFALAGGKNYDVIVFHNTDDKVPNMLYFEKEYFDKFNCTIGANKALSTSDKIYIDLQLKPQK